MVRVMTVKRRNSMYPDQISLHREFHHAGMWFTLREYLIDSSPHQDGPTSLLIPSYYDLQDKPQRQMTRLQMLLSRARAFRLGNLSLSPEPLEKPLE
jgi:hypothetical protein